MTLKDILDNAVNTDRFSINNCIEFENYVDTNEATLLSSIKTKLSAKQYKAFKKSIIRNSFLIEPVNESVTSTKVETHWSNHLSGDVRFSSYEDCYKIFTKLLSIIDNLDAENLALLKEFFDNTVVAYEMPVDYINRNAKPIHNANNIDLFLNDEIKKCIAMRRFMRNKDENPASDVFQTILSDKIQVKTYLTDRALTGAYKTNREKRWEAHPESVQYALRRECMQIETKLLLQIATFEGCYPDLVLALQNKGLLDNEYEYCKCPITGDNIQYSEFEDDVLNPTHGKSKFQVGHLNPLKKNDADSEASGHSADNISWISENGNRIQGSLSLNEVNQLLKRIYSNRPELRS